MMNYLIIDHENSKQNEANVFADHASRIMIHDFESRLIMIKFIFSETPSRF
jgi:hypothetical protein